MSGAAGSSRIDRALWIFAITGAVVLGGALLTILIQLHSVHAEIERGLFRTDPQLGLVFDAVQLDERLRLFGRAVEWPEEHLHEFSGFGLLGVLLLGGAVAWLGRRSGVPLGLIACSISLPIAIGLAAGLLSTWRFEGLVEDSFELLMGRSLPIGSLSGGCTLTLTPCSHVQALELIGTLTVAITCVLTAIIFMLAARRVWVIGERGTTLPRRWAIAATALFGLGGVSLVGSTPHAADHARAASECDGYRDDSPYSLSIPNSTSTDLYGVSVESCGADPWRDYLGARGFEDIGLMASFQVFSDGSIASLDEVDRVEFVTPEQFTDSIENQLDMANEIRRVRDEPLLDEVSIVLYADERAPAMAIHEYLDRAQAVGVTSIVLFGQSRVEASLESVGTWTRGYLCPIATLRFADDAPELSDFETWGEIITLALERGPEPSRLQP